MIASTITIPTYSHPNLLWAALRSLVEHSYFKHRIIILWTDYERVPSAHGCAQAGATDWLFGHRDGKWISPYREFESVRDFLTRKSAWLAEHGIETIDLSDRMIKFRDEQTPPGGEFHGGTAIAHLNNIGLEMTSTEWTIPNWDCDFYAGWHWDKAIFEYAHGGQRDREYLIPMHVQPAHVSSEEANAWDPWRDSARISTHRLAIPTPHVCRVGSNDYTIVTRNEFFRFIERWRRPGERILEPCGVRQRLHWVPWVLKTSDIRAVGGFSHMGSGYDLAFDNAFGSRGFTKVGFCDSFIMHKGFPPMYDGPPT